MSAKQYQPSLKLALAHEGGYVNHPKDPGGATNKGVTQAVYDAYRLSKVSPKRSVKLITDAEVTDIYKTEYWDRVAGDQLPAGLDYAVFDYGINSGVAKAIKDLQRTINANANVYGVSGLLKVDGVAGLGTINAACKAADADEIGLIVAYCNRRISFMKSLKTWSTFGKGWFRRVMGAKDGAQKTDNGVIDYAVRMAEGDLTFPIPKKDLPKAIGVKDGEEQSAKAVGSDQSAPKSAEGIGAIAAAAGVSGQTVIAAAEQVKPHIGDSMIGKIALAGFIVLMLAGVGLIVWNFFERRKEKNI